MWSCRTHWSQEGHNCESIRYGLWRCAGVEVVQTDKRTYSHWGRSCPSAEVLPKYHTICMLSSHTRPAALSVPQSSWSQQHKRSTARGEEDVAPRACAHLLANCGALHQKYKHHEPYPMFVGFTTYAPNQELVINCHLV